MRLFPRHDDFFDLFHQLVLDIKTGTRLFEELFTRWDEIGAYADRIKEVERDCDKKSAAILDLLNSSFITPLDREDIYTLAIELDDIMDMINAVARTLVLYRVDSPTEASTKLAELLGKAVEELVAAFSVLKSHKDLRPHIDRIRGLEEESDIIAQDAIHRLFSNGQDPIDVIKWLKIYESMENSLDRCRKVAKVLAGILVKNA